MTSIICNHRLRKFIFETVACYVPVWYNVDESKICQLLIPCALCGARNYYVKVKILKLFTIILCLWRQGVMDSYGYFVSFAQYRYS